MSVKVPPISAARRRFEPSAPGRMRCFMCPVSERCGVGETGRMGSLAERKGTRSVPETAAGSVPAISKPTPPVARRCSTRIRRTPVARGRSHRDAARTRPRPATRLVSAWPLTIVPMGGTRAPQRRAVAIMLFLHKHVKYMRFHFGRKFYRRPEPSKSSGVDGVRWRSDPDSVRGFATHDRIFPVARVCQLIRFGSSQRAGGALIASGSVALRPDAGPHISSSQQQHPGLRVEDPRRRHAAWP
mgnify:CR=1 FL=1